MPEYKVWAAMKQRCQNPRNSRYHRYGGRGITVCPEWLDSFDAFLAHVGPRPSKGYSLERINNNGNYEPGNVKWATHQQQALNRSTTRAKDGNAIQKQYGVRGVSMTMPLTKEAHEINLRLSAMAERAKQRQKEPV